MKNEPIPGVKLSQSAQTALSYAAWVIDKDHELANGKTALFWHLMYVAHSHIKAQEASDEAE